MKLWTAWNEPNNPVFLAPQYKKVNGKWMVESAYNYARICNAVYAGIHTQPGEKVACGFTDPKGNDSPGSSRASVDPLSFLIAAHRYGMKRFDAYAHNPYASAGNESPSYVPKGNDERRIQLGNIGLLLSEISRLYGPKHPVDHGVQLPDESSRPDYPPDKAAQGQKPATYLKQCVRDRPYQSAHRHAALVPRSRPAPDRRLAVGPGNRHGRSQTGVERVPERSARLVVHGDAEEEDADDRARSSRIDQAPPAEPEPGAEPYRDPTHRVKEYARRKPVLTPSGRRSSVNWQGEAGR